LSLIFRKVKTLSFLLYFSTIHIISAITYASTARFKCSFWQKSFFISPPHLTPASVFLGKEETRKSHVFHSNAVGYYCFARFQLKLQPECRRRCMFETRCKTTLSYC